ncbi:MAG TPA: HAMP domain-containing sensor histidine kinase [Nitrososphaeraceae archaeon]|nr:HAMP domain-containing sensor histidine kinase [Nitrososphaeraceae archaeon]
MLLQVEKYLDSSSNIPQVKAAMDKLESNIQTLKQGGKISDIELKPLPSEFSGSWDIINKKWQSFKAFINNEIINSSKQSSLTTTTTIGQSSSSVKKTQLESMAAGLIDSSDVLVTKLGLKAGQNSQNLTLLGLVLGIINIGILVLILYLVIKILRPIFALTTATSKIKKGNFDVSVELPKGSNDELSILSESFNSMLSSIRDYIKYQNELKNEIQKANEELKNKNRLMDEFIKVAAHELRTPIQPILGLSEIIRCKVDNKEHRKSLDVIIRNSKRLQQLTEDILDVSKIESGSLILNKEKFNLEDMIRDILRDYSHNIESKNDNLKLSYKSREEDGTFIIEGDKSRLSQVISNLLSNAIKFTNEGSIDVIVEIKDNNNENIVVVRVRDTGTGIHSEIFPRLFSKFATKSRTGGGTGLGLFISKSIIEKHGGRIWAENNSDGRGATFSFTLPILVSSEPLSKNY